MATGEEREGLAVAADHDPMWDDELPIEDDELRVPASEAAQRRVPAGQFRTRVLSYSGYGPTDFPLIEVPEAFARLRERKVLGKLVVGLCRSSFVDPS